MVGQQAKILSRTRNNLERREDMAWKAPVIVELALGAEINSYACAVTTT
jgi:coenzyme PQQ precursor peptide PqqA